MELKTRKEAWKFIQDLKRKNQDKEYNENNTNENLIKSSKQAERFPFLISRRPTDKKLRRGSRTNQHTENWMEE